MVIPCSVDSRRCVRLITSTPRGITATTKAHQARIKGLSLSIANHAPEMVIRPNTA